MAFEELMGLTNRLLANALALSAVSARLQLDQGLELVDPLREVAWSHDDAVLLRAQGSASAVVATDLAWLPSFFIPESVLDDAMRRVHGLLRPGGRSSSASSPPTRRTRWRGSPTTS